jgi:hypothetical protein
LHRLQQLHEGNSRRVGRGILRVVHHGAHLRQNLGSACFQGAHLLLPDELLLGAAQQIFEIRDVFARALAVAMLLVHRVEFTLKSVIIFSPRSMLFTSDSNSASTSR